MPEPETYEPSGELKNLRADEVGRTKDAELKARAGLVRPAVAPDPNREVLEDGRPVVAYDDTPKPAVRFTRSQIARMDAKTYAENRDDIIQANLLGLIENDVTEKARKVSPTGHITITENGSPDIPAWQRKLNREAAEKQAEVDAKVEAEMTVVERYLAGRGGQA